MFIGSAFDLRCVCMHHFVVKCRVLMCCTEEKSFSVLQHDGQPYCHKPCYAVLFGPKGMKGDTGKKLICLQLQSDPLHKCLHICSTWIFAHVCWQFTCLLLWQWWSFMVYYHSHLRRKHRRCWQLHLWWPRGGDTTMSLAWLKWQTLCTPVWKLQAVCCICIFFIQVFK